MPLSLGPIPAHVQSIVRLLIEEAQNEPPITSARPNGLLLTAGPGGASYLDADGEVWDHHFWDGTDSIDPVADGPRKVGLIAIAAARFPGLEEWLPNRPAIAVDCQLCRQTGWLQPPLPRIQCPECNGMGWLERDS